MDGQTNRLLLLIEFLDSHSKLLTLSISFIFTVRIVTKLSPPQMRISHEQKYQMLKLMPGSCKPSVSNVKLCAPREVYVW